jgi:flagellar basal-body rod protein FlgC
VVFAANRGDPQFLSSLVSASGSATTGNIGSGPMISAAQSTTAFSELMAGGPGDVAPGVHIAAVIEDPASPLKRYDPGHPDAGPDGYVSYPDINPVTEMVDLMGATRAYGLNSSAVLAEKGMISAALEIAKTS